MEHKKGRGTKELEQFRHLSKKIKVTSNVGIIEKNKKPSNRIARYN